MTARTLTQDQFDQAEVLLLKIKGVSQVIGAASLTGETLPDNAISNASWALESLLDHLGEILTAVPKSGGGNNAD